MKIVKQAEYAPAVDDRARPEAVMLWLEGMELKLRFPDSHTVTIDTRHTKDGAAIWPVVLLNILNERARVERSVIATAAAPVQYDIEAIARHMRAIKPENFQAKPTTPVEEFDLSDMSFD